MTNTGEDSMHISSKWVAEYAFLMKSPTPKIFRGHRRIAMAGSDISSPIEGGYAILFRTPESPKVYADVSSKVEDVYSALDKQVKALKAYGYLILHAVVVPYPDGTFEGDQRRIQKAFRDRIMRKALRIEPDALYSPRIPGGKPATSSYTPVKEEVQWAYESRGFDWGTYPWDAYGRFWTYLNLYRGQLQRVLRHLRDTNGFDTLTPLFPPKNPPAWLTDEAHRDAWKLRVKEWRKGRTVEEQLEESYAYAFVHNKMVEKMYPDLTTDPNRYDLTDVFFGENMISNYKEDVHCRLRIRKRVTPIEPVQFEPIRNKLLWVENPQQILSIPSQPVDLFDAEEQECFDQTSEESNDVVTTSEPPVDTEMELLNRGWSLEVLRRQGVEPSTVEQTLPVHYLSQFSVNDLLTMGEKAVSKCRAYLIQTGGEESQAKLLELAVAYAIQQGDLRK